MRMCECVCKYFTHTQTQRRLLAIQHARRSRSNYHPQPKTCVSYDNRFAVNPAKTITFLFAQHTPALQTLAHTKTASWHSQADTLTAYFTRLSVGAFCATALNATIMQSLIIQTNQSSHYSSSSRSHTHTYNERSTHSPTHYYPRYYCIIT